MIKKYFHLFSILLKNNLIREMEFRSHFVLETVMSILWIAFQFFTIQIYFQFTDQIAGWTKAEVLLLIGFFRLSKGLFDLFLKSSLYDFPNAINRGDLDYALTRPVSSMFIIFLRRYLYSEISTFVAGVFLTWYAFQLSPHLFSQISLVLIVVGVLISLIAYYSVMMIFTTTAIFTSKLTAIAEFQEILAWTVRYPMDVYTRRQLIPELLFLPISLIVTIPVRTVLGKIDPLYIFVEIFISFIIFWLVIKYWGFALKHYSSASS